jgi:hypothetical protein
MSGRSTVVVMRRPGHDPGLVAGSLAAGAFAQVRLHVFCRGRMMICVGTLAG